MKGREGKGPPQPADLLVCFPTRRAHLTLMPPKPICSPARPADPATRHNHHRRHHSHHHLRNSGNRAGHASPILWANTKSSKSQNSDLSEPTSPKVTCAGQIKVRPKPGSCKNWQSVMEEIERLHNSRRKQRRKSPWSEALGFKKDVMQFLTCLRNIRFDFRCFGSFPTAVISSDDDEEEEEVVEEEDDRSSGDVFSKWFMILQEKQGRKGKTLGSCLVDEDDDDEEDENSGEAAPPANALLLMRCRSAPAKSWLEEREEEKEEAERKQGMVVMRCGGDEYSKLSGDIAKETWVVGAGGIKDMLSRSRSYRR